MAGQQKVRKVRKLQKRHIYRPNLAQKKLLHVQNLAEIVLLCLEN